MATKFFGNKENLVAYQDILARWFSIVEKVKKLKKKLTAIIFGITGQDGSYLADHLLKKKYKILGITRKISKKLAKYEPSWPDIPKITAVNFFLNFFILFN